MRERDELNAMQKLGAEAEAFIVSPLGRHLIAKAEDEVAAAVEQLKTHEPTDTEGIRRIQNDIRVAESFNYWLAEAVQSGINAISAMELMDAPDA